MAWLRVQVPEKVHRQLKAAAALAGVTLAEYVAAVLIEATTKGEEA